MRPSKTFLSLCAIAGVLTVGNASAALKLSDAFDGNYFSPSESGRGISVDYVPFADGSGFLFGALFSFDADNNPAWLTIQGAMLEHEFTASLDVFQTTGGAFGFPFPGVSNAKIGTATVTVNSCTSMSFDIDMDEGSGFPDVMLENLTPVAGLTSDCVYLEEFQQCPDFATAIPGIERACALNGVITQDITLTNETTWLLDGLVRIGDDNENSATVTIEPGTVLIGGGGSADYLYISPGSRIIANGTPNNPIVLTSDQDGFISGTTPNPGDVGGLVVSGNAPSNACETAPFNCFSEFDQTQRFGGDNPNDSSGQISYFQVRYAGIEFQPNAEVNSFTFQGVGDGTVVHHLQAFRGQDDGVEFFGGTVNVNHIIITEGGDDAIDWDLGWSGKMQYALVVEGTGFGEDNGIEGASNPDDFDATPRATPVVSNFTFIGTGGDGIELKQGSGGQIWNSIVTGFTDACINFKDAATYTAAGTPQSPSGTTAFAGVILNCPNNFKDDGSAPYAVQDLFNASSGNELADPKLNGYQPTADSPALDGGLRVEGSDYFDFTSYRGAFDGSKDWTAGWTHQVLGGGN